MVSACLTGVVVLFLSFTGVILTYERQIIAWQERGYRVTSAENSASPLPLDRVVAIASGAAGKPSSSVVLQADSRAPVEVDFGRDQRLFLNPFTGVVLGGGATRTRAFFRTVTELHRWFGAPLEVRPVARTVKSVFNWALLLLIVTGTFLWLPGSIRWQRIKAGAFFRSGLTGRARQWNQHNVLGIWAAIPIAIIVISGAFMVNGLATNLLYKFIASPLPEQAGTDIEQKHHAHHKAGSSQVAATGELQQAVTVAERWTPGWRILRVIVPKPEDSSIRVSSESLNGARPDKKTELTFDRRTGEITKFIPFSSYNLSAQIRAMARYVHTGEAEGLAGQTGVGHAGLACCALVWTGLSMSFRRLRALRDHTKHE